MNTPLMPDSISLPQLQAAVRALGIQPDNVVALTLNREEVQVTQYMLDDQGNKILVNDDHKTHTIIIPVLIRSSFPW